MFKLIIKASSLSLFIRLGGVGLMLLVHILFARTLSKNDYGLYIYAINLLQILALISRSGLENNALRFATLYKEKNSKKKLQEYLSLAFIFPVIISVLIILLMVFIVFLLNNPASALSMTYMYIAWIIAFYAILGNMQSSLQAIKKIFFSQIFEQIILPILLLFILLIIINKQAEFNFQYAINSYGFIMFLLALICSILVFKFYNIKPTIPKISNSIFWLKESIFLTLNNLITLLLNRIDLLLLGLFLLTSEIANYGVAGRIAGLVIFINAAIANITNPLIAELYHKKKYAEIRKMLKIIIIFALLFSLLTLAFLAITGKFILSFFGTEYISSYKILLILAFAQAFNLFPTSLSSILIISGKQKELFKISLISLIIIIILLLILIPQFGTIGAAISTLIGVFIANILLLRKIYLHENITHNL